MLTNLRMELFQALLQRLLPLLHCCCLISSTNSKLVTVPQGLVSPLLVLVQLHNTGLTITLTKQIHTAQMLHKNICRKPVKYLNAKKYFRWPASDAKGEAQCSYVAALEVCHGAMAPRGLLLGSWGWLRRLQGLTYTFKTNSEPELRPLSPHSAAGGSCVCARLWLVTRVTRDT